MHGGGDVPEVVKTVVAGRGIIIRLVVGCQCRGDSCADLWLSGLSSLRSPASDPEISKAASRGSLAWPRTLRFRWHVHLCDGSVDRKGCFASWCEGL